MSNQPTVLDVGRVAGVSRQTVSNVINSPELVRPATREKVQAAIAELGYRPHASARRLRTQKSGTLGIRLDPMTNGISGSVLDRFLHALTEQADRRGLRVMLFTATGPEDEIRQFGRLRDGADVDAFVLTSTFHGDPRTEWLIEHNMPFVTFGRPWGIDDMNDPRHLWVDVDGFSGVREATSYLLGSGALHVAYLGWPSPSGTGDDRRRGWRAAMEGPSSAALLPALSSAGLLPALSSAGLSPAALLPAALSPVGIDALDLSAEDGVSQGRAAVQSLLDAGVRVDAVVAASDSLALGALLAVDPAVPVIGYDNTPVAEAVGLSSVEQPLDEVAAGALELLLGSSGNDVIGWNPASTEARHRLVTPRLVVRQRPAVGGLR